MSVWKFALLAFAVLMLASCGAPVEAQKPTIGMILVGPKNDGGWSQAHYEAMKQVEAEENVTFIYVDKVNPADRPNVSAEKVASELISQGATMIIANSDDFKDSIREAAVNYPNVSFLHASGDDVMTGKAPANLGNMMGQMEYGKMIAGCAAALESNTGKIAYVGPLINDETRRLVNAAYLGAQYCWTSYKAQDPALLRFSVKWIGFWFNIPGVTLDPTLVINDYITQGYDVIMSGIDTPEVVTEVAKAHASGKAVKSIPYDFKGACDKGPAPCIGVPYFNWYPEYKKMVQAHIAGTWKPGFVLFGPNFADLNNHDTSGIGFMMGAGLTQTKSLGMFLTALKDGLNLWTGPLMYKDGSTFIPAGATGDTKTVWYQTQLLKGIDGQ
jgi:simple sugar transport system substrate-binding protein